MTRRVAAGLVGSLLASFVMPALAQAQSARPAPPGRASPPSWNVPLTADGRPDLEGVWTDTSATPLERPQVYAGRAVLTDAEVAQLEARAARLASDHDNSFLAGDNLFLTVSSGLDTARNPNATGAADGMVAREFDNRTSLITDPPDGRLPRATPAGLARQAAGRAATLAIPWRPGLDPDAERRLADSAPLHPPASAAELSNLLRCISWGVPKIAGNTNYTGYMQIVQTPGELVLLSEVNHEARVVPLDGRPHLADALRQWHGDSRGRWEGRTLVVETTNFSPKSFFRGSADGLHLVERFTRVGPDRLTYEITVSDPSTWERPWTAVIYLRRADAMLYESACHEGNLEVMRGILAGARAEDRGR